MPGQAVPALAGAVRAAYDDGGLHPELVVDVDGVPMSARVAEAPEPRAVVVALHGGAVTSRYFDAPGRPWLSLLRAEIGRAHV